MARTTPDRVEQVVTYPKEKAVETRLTLGAAAIAGVLSTTGKGLFISEPPDNER
jgi:hypothetical protein